MNNSTPATPRFQNVAIVFAIDTIHALKARNRVPRGNQR
jgi:hypothetical protein